MSNPLEEAPTHVKLAVDLIMILEQHDVEPEEVLKALALRNRSLTRFQKHTSSASTAGRSIWIIQPTARTTTGSELRWRADTWSPVSMNRRKMACTTENRCRFHSWDELVAHILHPSTQPTAMAACDLTRMELILTSTVGVQTDETDGEAGLPTDGGR